MNQFEFTSKIWVYPGMAAWRFVSLPKDMSKKIKTLFGSVGRGFGSLRVEVVIGKSQWKTSIFPDKKSSTYLLPLKAEVRKKENIQDNQKVKVLLKLLL